MLLSKIWIIIYGVSIARFTEKIKLHFQDAAVIIRETTKRGTRMTAEYDVTGIRLETPRLILRPVAEGDFSDYFEYMSNPAVTEPEGMNALFTEEEARSVLQTLMDRRETLALVLKDGGKMVGTLSLQARDWEKYPISPRLLGREFGFDLNPAFWGRGLMPEAVQAAAEYCFEVLHCDYLTCGHFLGNDKSARVIQKCGFQFLFDTSHTFHTGRTERIRTYIRYRRGSQ